MENPPVNSELMRFVTVRNPETISTESIAATAAYVTYNISVESPSATYSKLTFIKSNHFRTNKDKVNAFKTVLLDFIQNNMFVESIEHWKQRIPNLI